MEREKRMLGEDAHLSCLCLLLNAESFATLCFKSQIAPDTLSHWKFRGIYVHSSFMSYCTYTRCRSAARCCLHPKTQPTHCHTLETRKIIFVERASSSHTCTSLQRKLSKQLRKMFEDEIFFLFFYERHIMKSFCFKTNYAFAHREKRSSVLLSTWGESEDLQREKRKERIWNEMHKNIFLKLMVMSWYLRFSLSFNLHIN